MPDDSPSTGFFADLFRRGVVDQWRKLEDEHAAMGPPTGTERAKVAGMYVVALLTLWASQDLMGPTWRLIPDDWVAGPQRRFYRHLYWAWFLVFVYAVPPALYARYVLGLSLRDLGLRGQGLFKHAWIYLLGFALVLPLVFAVAPSEAFQESYPFYRRAGQHLGRTAAWELSYAAQFAGLELFFRGFLLFGAFRVLGPWAIPAMVLPYMALHFSKPELEALASIFAGIFLGIVALRTKSIVFGVVIHVGVAWTMDALAIWYRSG